MSTDNVIPLHAQLFGVQKILNDSFDDDGFASDPLLAMQRVTEEILRALKFALPTESEIPEPDALGLAEWARLAGVTPEDLAHFIKTAKPAKGAQVTPMPEPYPSRARALFCDKLDEDGRKIGLLIALPTGSLRWRIYDLPLTYYRKALDAVHSKEKYWNEFVQSVDEFLVAVAPHDCAAQSMLREFSKASTPVYENIVSSGAVNFRVVVRGIVNAVCLFRLASLERGHGIRDTLYALTNLHTEGGLQLNGQRKNPAVDGTTRSDASSPRNPERTE